MNYFVRSVGNSTMFGPYSIAEISQNLGAGTVRPDYEAHAAEGQSHGALLRSINWVPISSLPGIDAALAQAQSRVEAPVARPVTTISVVPSGVASALSVFAYLELLAAPIAGFIIGTQQSAYFGSIVFFSGFLGGLILLGFSKVVEHLSESAQRLRQIERVVQGIANERKG